MFKNAKISSKIIFIIKIYISFHNYIIYKLLFLSKKLIKYKNKT